MKYLSWFSAGAPSAVTAKLALTMYGAQNVTVAYTDPGSEHPDNDRFIAECEEWFGVPVLRLKSEVYEDTVVAEDEVPPAPHVPGVGPVFLADLDPQRGDHASEPDIDCSLLCVTTEDEIADGKDAA